jgi:hypothetical protein
MATRQLLPRVRESRFRGNELNKKISSTDGNSFQQILNPKLIREEISNFSSPSITMLGSESRFLSSNSAEIFPVQIEKKLATFSKISFSNLNLFELILNRKSDLLIDASPKRIVSIIRSLASLNLPIFHPEIYPEIRSELTRLLPQLRRGVPGILQALAEQDCDDVELIEGLGTQILELVKLKEIEINYLIDSIYQISKFQNFEKFTADLITQVLSLTTPTPRQSVMLWIAATRSGTDPSRHIDSVLTPLGGETGEVFRLIEFMGRVGVDGVTDLRVIEKLGEFIELNKNSKFIPYTLNSVNSITNGNEEFKKLFKLIFNSLNCENYSPRKLLKLLSIYESTSPEFFQILSLLSPLSRSLTVRESRDLWPLAPGLTPVHALPPLLPRGREADEWEVETVGPLSLVREGDGLSLYLPKFKINFNYSNKIEKIDKIIQEKITVKPLR